MFGLDEAIAGLAGDDAVVLATILAVLLGLRHATDPDHLCAVVTLGAGEPRGSRDAAALGLAWGAGHATTLIALGLVVVIAGAHVPESVERSVEAAVGVIIVILALRLLQRWRRQRRHDSGRAAPRVDPYRTSAEAYGIGLLHGIGGSGGVAVLLLGRLSPTAAVVALCCFATAAAASIALCSAAFASALASGVNSERVLRVTPALACASAAFGAYYVAGSLGLVQYPF